MRKNQQTNRIKRIRATEKPSAVLERTYGSQFEKLSRSEKLFLIQMIAAQLYATDPQPCSQEVFYCIPFANRQLSILEQEQLLNQLTNSLSTEFQVVCDTSV